MSIFLRENVANVFVNLTVQSKQSITQQWHYVVMLLCMFALSACQSLPSQELSSKKGGKVLQKNAKGFYQNSDFEQVEQIRAQVSAWQLKGSFSYVDPKETGAGRIQWEFQGVLQDANVDSVDASGDVDVIENEKVRLVGPIGTGSLELVSSDSSAVLISGRERYFGADVESLLLKTVGWRLPVNELRFWLFGMPSSGAEGRYWLNEQGLLQSLQQSDWEIEFDRYQVNPLQSYSLPQKIIAVHRGNQAKIKLVIKQFQTQ